MEAADSAVPPSNTIFCLYCRATIAFPGLPANRFLLGSLFKKQLKTLLFLLRYLQHLFAEHNIMHEVQSVINRTL